MRPIVLCILDGVGINNDKSHNAVALTDMPFFNELLQKCRWVWQSDYKRYKIIGPNGNYIYMTTAGYKTCSGNLYNVGYGGYYWSSTENESGTTAVGLDFDASNKGLHPDSKCSGRSVRLVRN